MYLNSEKRFEGIELTPLSNDFYQKKLPCNV